VSTWALVAWGDRRTLPSERITVANANAQRAAVLANTRHGLYSALVKEKYAQLPEAIRDEVDLLVETEMAQGYLEKHRWAVQSWAVKSFWENYLFRWAARNEELLVEPVVGGKVHAVLAAQLSFGREAARMHEKLREALLVDRELDPGKKAPWAEVGNE